MTEIKITDVIRCSSEDAIHSSSNLLKGASSQDYWVCANDNKESKIEVELEFAKEAVISFIDIGNHGSQSVDILVSHSSRCRDEYFSIIPTFNFMSVAESKQGINRNKVQMFSGDDMLSEYKLLTWDRLKLVCRQLNSNGKQFGLNFICLKTVSRSEQDLPKKQADVGTQNKLNNFFNTLVNTDRSFKKPNISLWSSPLSPKVGHPKSPRLKENRSPVSPTDQLNTSEKTPQRILSATAIAQFKDEVACFLEDINISKLMATRTIKVSDLRIQMENQRGLALVRQQKMIFMEIITEKLKELKHKSPKVNMTTPTNRKVENIDIDPECEKCHTRLPKSVISIHSKICNPTTPNRTLTPRYRNQLCFDLGDVEDEKENPKKRRKMNSSQTISSPNLNNLNRSCNSEDNAPADNSDDSVKSKLCSILTKDSSHTTGCSSLNTSATAALERSDSILNSICLVKDSPTSDDEQTLNSDRILSRRLSDDIASDLEMVGNSSNLQTMININDVENTNDMDMETETSECPICFRLIPQYKIAIHASSCEGKMEDDSDDGLIGGEGLSTLSTDMVNKVLDHAQCPICEKFMPKRSIELHVNICLDLSSSNCGNMSS